MNTAPPHQHASNTSTLHSTLTPLASCVADLEHDWRALEQHADASFFTSWGWIGPWLKLVERKNCELYLYRCSEGDTTIALGILSRSTITRRKLFRSRVLALNEVHHAGLNMTIEHNDLVIRRGHETAVRSRFANDLIAAPVAWDELVLSGIPEAGWQTIAGSTKLRPIIDEQFSPWATDISAIANDLDKLLAPLSRNRRWQIRRSFKAFQEDGELTTINATSRNEALAFFQEMGELHTQRWNQVGEAGSFANRDWVDFHRAVINAGFERDEIQLLKISAGEKPIGYVYSFIWRGTAYMLQTGFVQEDDNTRRPGFVSHCLAMLYNSTRGATCYDYMCGDAEYKRVLGVASSPLVWGRLQKWRTTFVLEHMLTAVARRVRKKID